MNFKEKNNISTYGNLKIYSISLDENGKPKKSLLLNKKILNKKDPINNEKNEIRQ